tara:strand:- start:197 stop:466 length:270 start_codon:yes stop_codon:yes gene_type:complete
MCSDKILMSKVSFMEIPKIYRRAYLETVTETYHNDMQQEQPRPDLTVFGSTYYFDYKFIAHLKYYVDTDIKYNLIKSEPTGDIYCWQDF